MAKLYIVSTYPNHNTINIPREAVIEVLFNRDLNQMTIPGNFALYKKVGANYTQIDGSLDYEQKMIKFIPSALEPNTEYQFRVLADITDLFGNPLEIVETFNFVTKDEILFEDIVITSPNENVIYNSVPVISWMAVSGAVSYDIEISATTDFSNLIWSTTIVSPNLQTLPLISFSQNPYFIRMRHNTGSVLSPWGDPIRFFYQEELPQILPDLPAEEQNDEDAALAAEIEMYEMLSSYDPLYCSYKEVLRETGLREDQVNLHTVLSHIQDASLYARQLREYAESNNTRLTPTDWSNVEGLPIYIKQYVKFQAAYNTLYSFYIERSSEAETITLSDLEIDTGSDIKDTINTVLKVAERKVRPWMDLIMNFGVARGYGMPAHPVKGQISNPYPDFMTRSIETE